MRGQMTYFSKKYAKWPNVWPLRWAQGATQTDARTRGSVRAAT